MDAAGVQKENSLRDAGFTGQEIDQWRTDTRQNLLNGGFSNEEADNYFGNKTPNMNAAKNVFKENLAKTPPKEGADFTFMDALDAGWQNSVSGLMTRGQKPDVLLPENAPMAARITSNISQLAGDVPAMVAGAFAGGAAGTAVAPGPGTVVGAGAGSFALPAAMRKVLMDHYEKGDIKDAQDFYERASSTLWEATKQGTVGALTAGAGGVAAKVIGPAVTPALRVGGQTAAEIATMVTAGKAVEGQIPDASDFVDAAILVGGMHGAGKIAGKIRETYSRTGVKPEVLAEQSQSDPTIKQDLLSSNKETPEAYGMGVELGTPKIKIEPPKGSLEQSNVLVPGESKVEMKVPPLPEVKTPELPVKSAAGEHPILDKIVPSEKPETSMTWDKIYTKFVDDLHPLKQFSELLAGEKVLSTKEDPYSLARLTRGSYGKADQFLELAPFNYETLQNTGTKPLKTILEPFKNDLDGLREYAVASRTLELSKRGIETGIPLDGKNGANEIVQKGKKYEKAFNELVGFQNDTLTYLKDSGILSKENYSKMLEANKSYVPFFRLMEEGEKLKGGGRGLNVNNPIKGIKGSERPIIDPIESIIKNTYAYITLAERNRVLSTMADLADKNPMGKELMQKQPTPMKPVEVKSEEVQRFLKENGIDEGDLGGFTVFRPQLNQLAKDEIAVFRNGKREVYKIDEDVAKAVKAMDRESTNLFFKILAAPASSLRAGSVLTPDFMARNFSRDMMTAFNMSNGMFTPLDSLSGLKSVFKKDEHYQNWLKSGGANATMVSIDRDYINNNIFKLSKETGLIDKTWNVVKSPFEAMRVMSELIENSTRVGEFKRVTKGDTSAAKIFEGGMAAREVTLDFQRIGASTRAMNMITAFWNANVQGMDKAVRTLRDRPIQTSAKIAASITLPSVLLWQANKDDPRWDEIPRWQKDLFWIVMTKEHIYRIPKPQELGLLFGSLPERALEAYQKDNPKAFKDFAGSLGQAMTPSYIPTAVVPVVEHFANRSTFTGNTLVPSSVEKILPEYQYTDYTTESGKMLSKFVRVVPGDFTNAPKSVGSPIILENYIRAWSGNMGMYALQLADKALVKSGAIPDPVKPASTLADLPVIKAFVVRFPSATAQSIQDFHDRFNKQQEVIDTIHHLAKSGNFQDMEKEINLDSNQDKLMNLKGMQQALATQSRFIHLVSANKDMEPGEKRQIIDGIYMSMIETAKLGNEAMTALDKELKK